MGQNQKRKTAMAADIAVVIMADLVAEIAAEIIAETVLEYQDV